MKLIDNLRAEHELIDRVLCSLRTYADFLVRGEAELSDARGFLNFFQVYAGDFHHDKEEKILFPALRDEAMLPADRGPIAVILDDHHAMAEILAAMKSLVAANDTERIGEFRELAVRYSHALWLHMDAETSVLFPESEDRLRRNGVYELEERVATAEELEAAIFAEGLTHRYAPQEPDIARGDGCVMCPSYLEACRGLEREWWNQYEWEEHDGHIAAS